MCHWCWSWYDDYGILLGLGIMTLVLALPWGVYSDRMISSSDGTRCDNIRKSASNEHLAAGFAGNLIKIVNAVDAVKAGEDDPKELANFGVDGVIVRNGRILLIDSGKIWTKRKSCQFYATGTGWAEGMSFLSGLIYPSKKVTDKHIQATFRYVFRVRSDCGGGVDFTQG